MAHSLRALTDLARPELSSQDANVGLQSSIIPAQQSTVRLWPPYAPGMHMHVVHKHIFRQSIHIKCNFNAKQHTGFVS